MSLSDFSKLSHASVDVILRFKTFPLFSTNIAPSFDESLPIPKLLKTCFGYYSSDEKREIFLFNHHIHIHISPVIGHKAILRKSWIPWEIIWKITYHGGQFSAESDRTVSNLLIRRVFPKCRNLKVLGWNFGRLLKEEFLSHILPKGSDFKFPNFNENVTQIHWPQTESLSKALKSFPSLKKILGFRIESESDRFGKSLSNHKNLEELAIVKCNEKQFRYCRKNKSLKDIYVSQTFEEDTTRLILLTHQTIKKISTPFLNLLLPREDVLSQNNVLKELYVWGESGLENNEKHLGILSRSHIRKLSLVDCRLQGQDVEHLVSEEEGLVKSLESFEINDEEYPGETAKSPLVLSGLKRCEKLKKLQISAVTTTREIGKYLETSPLLTELSINMDVDWTKLRIPLQQCKNLEMIKAQSACKRSLLDDETFLLLTEKLPRLSGISFRREGHPLMIHWRREEHPDPKPFLEELEVMMKKKKKKKKSSQARGDPSFPDPSQKHSELLATVHLINMVLKKAERAYKKKRFSQSFELVDQLIKRDAGNALFVDLFLHRAKSSWKLGKYKRCLFDASHVLEKDKKNRDAFKFAVEASIELKRFREVIVLMRDWEGPKWKYLEDLVLTGLREGKEGGQEYLVKCGNCEKFSWELLQCVRCKKTCYCDRECQVAHFPKHKVKCKKKAKK